jgi:hypothetical protein
MVTTSFELRERDLLPHFELTTLTGDRVRYDALWQRRNLVLVLTDPTKRQDATAFASRLSAHQAEFEDAEAAVVVTSDSLLGLHTPCVTSGDTSQRPTVEDLLDWVRFARIQCPECPP